MKRQSQPEYPWDCPPCEEYTPLPIGVGPIDIYTVLGISPHCSHEEAKRVVRRRRIETHPDKLKRDGLSEDEAYHIDEVAKIVGFAADIVLDPARRMEHDQELLEWRIRHAVY